MNSDIDNIFKIFNKNNPNPQTELQYNNHYTLAVAVILSAQATDVSVNKATQSLFVKYNTPEAIVSLGLAGLKKYVNSIGLYNSKAKNIILMSQIIIDKHNSQIPDNFEELIALPGIGRKTANVILHCAFNQLTIAVDTHVYRVSRRIGLSSEENILKLEQDLLKNIPKKYLFYAHHHLILHGRYICKARKPQCDICTISKFCAYLKKS